MSTPPPQLDPNDIRTEPVTRRFNPLTLTSMALGIYLLALWIAVTVAGASLAESLIAAAVVVALAALAFAISRRRRRDR